jgi:hypothetical protein
VSWQARIRAGAGGFCPAAARAPGAAHAAAPRVEQLIVFRNGDADHSPAVRAARTTASVGGKRCTIGAGTALAALLRSKPGGLELTDYGSCSRKPADAALLYVKRIRRDVARGVHGWVYKVGNKVATAGAGDPTGAFGSGRLKPGQRITWFYCHMKANGCQRTLAIKPEALGGGQLRVTVRAYDDRGKARPGAGAVVHAGDVRGTADAKGVAKLVVPPGDATVYAELKGAVRSFLERVEVR